MKISRTLTAAALAAAAASTWGAREQPLATPAARYEIERAHCLLGETSQDQPTCLREAGAAYAQARRAAAAEQPERFEANRLQRCEPLPDDQRRDCIARMQGQGRTSGSVAGGGIYRELITIDDDGHRGFGSPAR